MGHEPKYSMDYSQGMYKALIDASTSTVIPIYLVAFSGWLAPGLAVLDQIQ